MNIIKFYDNFLNKIISLLKKKKKVNVMITGGNSIKQFYSYFNSKIEKKILKKINFFLSDERIFEKDSDTNFFFVKKTLFKGFKKKEFNLKNFFKKDKNLITNLDYFNSVLPKMDIIILSYGSDGHIASLFPGLEPQIKRKNVCFVYNKNNKFKFRISVTKDFIKKSKNKFLFFLGKEKKKIFLRKKKKILLNKEFKNFKIVLS
jgi:6-phosphogluconolactonase